MAGRPTLYDPDYCDMVVAWGREGKSLTWMAAQLDVSRECIYEWGRVHPEFSDALTRARVQAQAWWEDQGQTGMASNMFNGSVWAKNMSCRFQEDWRDKNETAITGAGGGAIKTETTLDVSALTPEQLKAIATIPINDR